MNCLLFSTWLERHQLPRANGRNLPAALCVLLFLAAARHAFAAEEAKPQLRGVFTMPRISLQELAPTNHPYALDRARANGLKFTDLPSTGSGLAIRLDGALFGLTDRGPNDMAKASKKKGGDRRVLPLPEFCPAIVRLELTNNQVLLRKTIPLVDSQRHPLSGQGTGPGEEIGYASAKAAAPLPPDPGGVDPESIDCLPDGRFVVSEEYSPSIFVVSRSGEVQMRYTPASKPLTGAPYPVRAILPDILRERRPNRGFESVAVSVDGQTLYAILQSPMGDDTDARFADSQIIRIVELDFTDPLDARVTGMFLMRTGPLRLYPESKRQDQVKINDCKWLAPHKLLALEQAKGKARLLIVDLTDATNILNRPDANTLAFETVTTDLAALKVQPASTTPVFDSTDIPAIDSDKLEGLALMGRDEILLSNDNDFGIGDNQTEAPSKVWRIRLPHSVR